LTNKTELNQLALDQLDSIKAILVEDLNSLIDEYTHEYKEPLRQACERMQVELNAHLAAYRPSSKSEAASASFDVELMNNTIDQVLYNTLNDKFTICKIVLFDSIFKSLLEKIFKMAVKCMEDSIVTCRRKATIAVKSTRRKQQAARTTSAKIFRYLDTMLFSSSSGSDQRSMSLDNKNNDDDDDDGDQVEQSSLIGQKQYKTIQHALKRMIEFFSADAECLNNEYLTQTTEYQWALRTLELCLSTPAQLIGRFVRTQNIQQNNIDFSKSYGKIRVHLTVKQSVRHSNEFEFTMQLVEIRELLVTREANESDRNGDYSPCVDVFLFGPSEFARKEIKCVQYDANARLGYFNESERFDFKLRLNKSQMQNAKSGYSASFMSEFELQIVVREANSPKQAKVAGMCVLNLSQVIGAANTWKRLVKEEMPAYSLGPHIHGGMEEWLSLRARLKISDEGYRLLKVLYRHVDYDNDDDDNNNKAVDFIRLKLSSRHRSSELGNFIKNLI
jgi:hypothetical protein